MNCKAGDLAIVVRDRMNGGHLGRLVEILYAAPAHQFELPDGYPHDGCSPDCWVIRLLGSKAKAPCKFGWRLAEYGVGPDAAFRPLPGETIERIEEATA